MMSGPVCVAPPPPAPVPPPQAAAARESAARSPKRPDLPPESVRPITAALSTPDRVFPYPLTLVRGEAARAQLSPASPGRIRPPAEPAQRSAGLFHLRGELGRGRAPQRLADPVQEPHQLAVGARLGDLVVRYAQLLAIRPDDRPG